MSNFMSKVIYNLVYNVGDDETKLSIYKNTFKVYGQEFGENLPYIGYLKKIGIKTY